MTSTPTTFREIILIFIGLIKLAIPVIASLALAVFIWGMIKFIARVGGDENAVQEGKQLMIWGVIGLFAMISVWGILGLLSSSFGFSSLAFPVLPT